MANISPVFTTPTIGTVVVIWETLADGDTGTMAQLARYPDMSIQAVGTFGGTTVTVQLSNNGIDWVTALDPSGNDIIFTAGGLLYIQPNSLFIRVITVGGAAVDVDVILVGFSYPK